MELIEFIKRGAEKFLQAIKNPKPILVCSHYDADGIASAALVVSALKKLEKNFLLRFYDSLEAEDVYEMKNISKNFCSVMLLDLGASFLNQLASFGVDVFVIDHHKIEDEFIRNPEKQNLLLINCRCFNDEKTSASILAYFFVSSLCQITGSNVDGIEKIALFGLIGDNMDEELSKTSSLFLKMAKEKGAFTVKKGLRIFSYSKPIHKAIEFGQIYIPEITGNFEKTVEFLRNIGISIKNGETYKTFKDLTEEEISRLITAILTTKIFANEREEKGADFLGNVYLVKIFDVVEDAREIATTINACGRMGKCHLALAYLLGKKVAKEKVQHVYLQYKYEILKGLEMIRTEENNSSGYENGENGCENGNVYIKREKNFIIINAKNKIKHSVIGVICSMISDMADVIVGMAYKPDGKIKISVRAKNQNAYSLLEKIKRLSGIEFEIGGHEEAAGAILDRAYENEFIFWTEKNLKEESITIKV
jgi:RecJ-like exonuclease